MENFFLNNQWVIWLAIAWSIPWKGVALWKSARNGRRIWFVVLFIFNTLAILEIIYIFFISRKEKMPSTLKNERRVENNNLIRGL